jgi:hypothetical protein
LSHICSLFALVIFETGSCIYAWARLAHDPPQVAAMTGVPNLFVEIGILGTFCLSWSQSFWLLPSEPLHLAQVSFHINELFGSAKLLLFFLVHTLLHHSFIPCRIPISWILDLIG